MALTKVSTPAIKDEAITLAKLLHGDSNSNGKFLRANNGADPTFESVITDLVNDTTPQLGGDLNTNGNNISFGDSASGSDDRLTFGASQDLQIYHDGNHSRIVDEGTGVLAIQGPDIRIHSQDANELMAKFVHNGAVECYYDNVKKLETRSGGIGVFGHIEAGDNNKLMLGDANDLQIYHNGTHSFIDDATNGNLVLRTNPSGTYSTLVLQAGQENSIICNKLGSVELYHITGVGNTSIKLQTVSNGAIIDNNCRIENINNKVASMVNAKSSLEYKVHQTNGQSALQGAIKSNGISGWGGDLEFYTKPADSNPNGNLQRRGRLTDAGELMIHDQPYSMVSRSSGQSVPNTTGTVIVFDSQHYDRGNNYNHTNGRFTAPVDGVYQVNVQAQYTGQLNQCHAGCARNGSHPGVGGSFDSWCNWGDNIRAGYFAQAIYCSAGDFLEAKTYHSNGGNRTLEANRTKMTIYLLG